MRLMLPMSDSEKQALMRRAADTLRFGRLHTVREESRADGVLVVSAKFSDSFGFVDHPRLTVHSTGKLEGFRCDCAEFRKTRCLCGHCGALASTFFDEVCSAPAVQEAPPKEAPIVPLFPPAPVSPPPVERISYAFCNSRQDLYPGKVNPRIPLARYYQMFGNNALARQLYSYKRSWGGSCFGFTTSATMFFLPDDPVNVPDFRVGAVYPADLVPTSRSKEMHMTLHTFLEGMQILQSGSPLIYRPRSTQMRNPDCLDEMCRRVLHFQQTKTDPVTMGVWRSPRYDGGHSVFPYYLEQNAAGQDRLYIYDPNHPMKIRYAYLEKDADGHYTNWRFPMSDYNEYASATGGQLAFDAYADYKQAWNERGGEKSDATMSVPRNVAIVSTDGEVLFRVTAEGTEAFRDDIYQILLTDMGDEADEQVMLTLPAGNYLVRNEDPQRESLEVMLSHVQQSISVRTNAAEVEITADDAAMTVSARIAQAGCTYSMELDAIFEEEGHIILLEGTTGEGGLTFGCCSGTLRAKGPLSEELASLYIDEELTDLSCIERLKIEVPHQEPLPQKKQKLILCSDQPEDAPAADETD